MYLLQEENPEDSAEVQPSEEGDEVAEGEEGADKSKLSGLLGNKKKLIIIVLAIVLILTAGAGAFFFVVSKHSDEEVKAKVDAPLAAKKVAFFPMEEMVVNLIAPAGGTRYLKLRLSLELESEEQLPLVEQYLPRITDDFQTFLRQLRVEDLQGSAGIFKLKENLLLRAQQSAEAVNIKDVLLQDLVIQ